MFSSAQNKLYNFHFQDASKREQLIYDKLKIFILFSVVGALGWAIRGTDGWGGTAGGAVVGFWWASLFYFLAKVRGIDCRWQFFALGFGIAFGGMTGYGQFTSWIKGVFMVNETEIIEISPAWGFIWMTLVGIEWGGMAGGFLSWTLKKPKNSKEWLIRIFIPATCGILGYYLVKLIPELFYPAYSEELYYNSSCADLRYCGRTLATIPYLAVWIGLTIGFMIAESILKNKEGVKIIGIMAVGFGIAFPLSALWFFGELDNFNNWWKLWEESIGAIGGLTIGVVFLRIIRKIENGDLADAFGNHETNKLIVMNKNMSIEEKQKIISKMDYHAHIALILGLFILFIYVAQGARRHLLEHLSWYTLLSYSDRSPYLFQIELGDNPPLYLGNFYLEEIIYMSICVFIGLYFVIRNLKNAKKKMRNNISLFPIKNPFTKFIKMSGLIALAGIFAIYPSYMIIFYVIFSAILINQLITYQDFFRSRNLIPDEYL